MIGWANFVASVELRYHVRLCGHPQYPALQKPSSIGIGTLKSLTTDIEAGVITFASMEPDVVRSLRTEGEATGTVIPRKERKDAGKKRRAVELEVSSGSGSESEERGAGGNDDDDETEDEEGAGAEEEGEKGGEREREEGRSRAELGGEDENYMDIEVADGLDTAVQAPGDDNMDEVPVALWMDF
jgi:hypothetical protein